MSFKLTWYLTWNLCLKNIIIVPPLNQGRFCSITFNVILFFRKKECNIITIFILVDEIKHIKLCKWSFKSCSYFLSTFSVQWCFRVMTHFHNRANSFAIFDHMILSFKPNISINLIFPSIISRMVNLAFFSFQLEKLFQLSSKCEDLFILYFSIFHTNFMSLGLLFLAVIFQKPLDIWPGVTD